MSYKDYFIYKGVAYGVGTKVLFSEKMYQKYFFSSKAKNQPHTFFESRTDGVKRFMWKEECDSWKKSEYSVGDVHELDEEIAEIVEPVYVNLVSISWQEKTFDNMINKKVQPDVFSGVLLYIVIMLIGSIFEARILLWSFATVIFIFWLLNEYRT